MLFSKLFLDPFALMLIDVLSILYIQYFPKRLPLLLGFSSILLSSPCNQRHLSVITMYSYTHPPPHCHVLINPPPPHRHLLLDLPHHPVLIYPSLSSPCSHRPPLLPCRQCCRSGRLLTGSRSGSDWRVRIWILNNKKGIILIVSFSFSLFVLISSSSSSSYYYYRYSSSYIFLKNIYLTY